MQTYTVVKCEVLLKYAKKIQQSVQNDFLKITNYIISVQILIDYFPHVGGKTEDVSRW